MKYLSKSFSTPANSRAYVDGWEAAFGEKTKCAGPVYFADQGIEVCETCGGCICCDHADVDHSSAEWECFIGNDGACHLKAHAGRDCRG